MSEAGLVIVGAGHAGISAALAARKAGYDGKLTMIAEDGVDAPYERPPLSKWSDGGALTQPIYPADQILSANLEQIKAEITALDPIAKTITLDDGRIISFGRLLLATGAYPRRLAQADASETDVYYLRHKSDADALKRACENAKNAVIIGAGFIGLELAASLRKVGLEVQVLEAAERMLARAISPPVAQIVHDLHRANGVDFLFGVEITAVQKDGPKTAVTLADGSLFTADIVIAGVGSVPHTALAEVAGLAVDNGILVDSYLQTSHSDIFAAGDCCRFPLYGDDRLPTRLESWQAAREQGEVAGRNMVSANNDLAPCALTPWFWSEQYDHVLQVAGIQTPDTRLIERAYGTDHHVTFGLSSKGALAFACGIAAGTKIAKDIRLSAKLIAAGAPVTEAQLSDPQTSIKSLIRR